MYNRIILILTILALLVFILPDSAAFAHLMLIEPVEEGRVRVAFDDGSAARHAEVVAFNKEGEEIARGDVDRDGYFSFPPEEAVFIEVDDGFGHRAEHIVGEEAHESLPRVPAVSGILAGFMIIAGVFHYRVRKKEKAKD